MFDLQGHVAVVTGGSTGLGLGMARGLARCGASVALWARQPERLAAAAEELAAAGAGGVLPVSCDVADEEAVLRAMAATRERFGRLDSLFANAGTARTGSLLETTLAEYRRQNAVNFEGMLVCFREAARQMIAQGGGGKLVATSSTAAILGSPDLVAYTATKGAMAAAVRALAVELGPHGIQVNALLPGVFRTNMTRRVEGIEERYLPKMPSTFLGTPRHIEGIAAFLASRESDYLTGTCIPLDGGISVAAYT
jgi:NAD(P)-dependent dehydrogenase (short-subunit alcohol dehydrogenase family)